jgi:hypothetical protein
MDAPALDDELVAWLLDGDPAIRWQVRRDLLGHAPEAVEAERDRVASVGWAATLLARQDADGRWAGGLYRPHWTGTHYTLMLLHRLGLSAGHPAAVRGVLALLDGAEVIDGGGLTFPDSTARHPEACITGMVVQLAAAFGVRDRRVEDAVAWLTGQILPDGGWNCESVVSATRHGSFHTTSHVLEGLLAYRDAGGAQPVGPAVADGLRFLLDHRLFRSHRTGAVASEDLLRFPFPPQWRYDALLGLEVARAAGAGRDPRLADAVDVLRARRGADGRWAADPPLPGEVWCRLESPGPGRWTTLRALRALRWWDGDGSD